jgi:hypothetical protein
VSDSFCLTSQLEVCYSNKTEDHYEFFTILNSTTPYILNYVNKKDGGIGLAPGTDGFKSYGEYLIDRKIISKNTVNVFYDSTAKEPALISLGLETNATRLGKSVNYLPEEYGSKDLKQTLWTTSYQGFELFGKKLDYQFANNTKSHFYIEYVTDYSVHISSDPQRALSLSDVFFNGTLSKLRDPADFFIKNASLPN